MLSTSKALFRKPGGGGPTPTDATFGYVPLLLNTTSTDGQQNNTFLDSSTNNFTITRNGTPTQGSRTPYWPNGQWSNYFNGSSDWLTVSSGNFSTTGDFTLEAWVYLTASGVYSGVASMRTSTTGTAGVSINITNSNFVEYSVLPGGSSNSATTIPINQWVHVALVRSGSGANNCSAYLNGVRTAQFSSTSSTNGISNVLSIGRYYIDGASQYYLPGYISNLRFVIGTPLYSGATITVPTSPLTSVTNTQLLTCQSNRFFDSNTTTTPKTITVSNTAPTVQAFQPFSPTASYTTALYGGSGIFSSGNYINAASNAAFGMGTGDFTIEAWIFATTAFSGYQAIFGDGFTTNSLFFGNTTGGFGLRAGNVADILVTTAPSINQWVHVACTRSGTTVRLFYNGVQQATTTSVTSFVTQTAYVGNDGGGSAFVGYISNLRLVKGTAVYTGNFTPPTLAPITTAGSTSAASYPSTTNVNTSFASSATSLLLNMTNAGIYDAAAQNNFTSFQNAVVSLTPTPTVGTTSLKVLTVGDYLTTPANPAFLLGTGDFTIEAWIYPTSTTSFISVMGIGTNGTTGDLQWFYNFSGNTNKVTLNCTGGTTVTSTASVPTGQWTYVAFSRASGSLKLFIGGALDKTASFTDNFTKNELVVGRSYASLNQEYFRGYVQDLRITKGVGRYNALTSIPVPTAPFPTR